MHYEKTVDVKTDFVDAVDHKQHNLSCMAALCLGILPPEGEKYSGKPYRASETFMSIIQFNWLVYSILWPN